MVVPLLLGLEWKKVHLDVGEVIFWVLALGTVVIEGGTRLGPCGEGRQYHEADALGLVHWVINIHTTHFALWVILFLLFLVGGDCVIL